ncbi:DNA-directed RNA polymerase III subunit RPC4 isoform X1 [Trichoplusia ni]|uniref:DNA-directed RNA polymerase III subunit RPC4 isoform X1 n=1 Tax=Trichoplusia ni TaxID=7111 RepID=A0A7E5WF68_TRINI|nr:DNA-directed RNA polymerase III subunit RPC4 isoform X1 [Trichoplusia ni]
MSEDKSSKTNGLGSDPMQRLASFKPPRDLTLGGIKTNKKVFTPNLNVSRNKNKGPAKPQPNLKRDEKEKRERRNDRNKNRYTPNIIKASGVFSEGLGAAERHASSRMSYGSRDSDTVQTLQKPTIRVKDVIKIDKELEEQKIKSVFGDSYFADDNECEDFKKINEIDAPIKLPMDDGGWSQVKPSVKVKQEVVVKREPEDADCVRESIVEEKPRVDVKESFENTDVVNLLRNDQPTLILLQLPDSLPGRGGKIDDDIPKRKNLNEQPSTSNDEEKEEKPVETKCRLADLEEGRIGKLLVHRSGRVSLKLGETLFEVCMGTKAAFHQEVVSVGTDDESRSANLVSLGALQHKLNLVPNWEAMFHNMSV